MIRGGYIDCSIENLPNVEGDDIKIDYGAMCEFGNMDIMVSPITDGEVSGILLYNKHRQNDNGVIMTFSNRKSIDRVIEVLLMARDMFKEAQG